MSKQSKELTVTAVQDQKSGQITAFFDELPGLVVQGNSDNDIKNKLGSLLDSYIKRYESRKNNMVIQTTVI